MPSARQHIGIIGSGPIGQGLATLFAEAGHDVVLGLRSARPRNELNVPDTVLIDDVDAAAAADIIVMAIRHDGAEAVAARLRDHLAGKIVVSTMNAVTVDDRGRIVSGTPDHLSEGQWFQRRLPNSTVVRAFSHIQDELLVSRAHRQPGLWAVAYATDDPTADAVVRSLISDSGYAPVSVGDLESSHILDPGGALFPRLLPRAEAEDLVTAHRVPQLLGLFDKGEQFFDVLHDNVEWTFPYGPSLGLPEHLVGKQNVREHLARVHASGVTLADITAHHVSGSVAVIYSTGHFPRPDGYRSGRIVSIVDTENGRIRRVHEYWNTQLLASRTTDDLSNGS